MPRRFFRLSLWLCAVACSSPPPGLPDGGALRRYPSVPSGGAPVLADAALVSVSFVGDGRTPEHDAFTRWLAESGWLLERTREYGVQRVSYRGGVVVDGAAGSDSALRAVLADTLQPAALYLVWMPEGRPILDRLGRRTCLSNPGTGYHESVDGSNVPYVVVPTCPARFSALLDVTQSMHLDGARLAVDALTNPTPRNAPAWAQTDPSAGWASLGAEVGDFCWGRLVERDGQHLQRVWSNAAVAKGEEPCVPTTGAVAFGLSVTPTGRRSLAIGETLTWQVEGWANGAMDDWRVEVTPWFGDFTMEASLDAKMMNAGHAVTLSVKVPFDVPPGTNGAVLLRGIGPDDTPLWPIAFVIK
ncbi:MAG: hypothetical protein IPJ65_02685 [Archangiaceae bacterium]|nr:hypothetical protein [Archangiaceae bacterium]